MKVVLAVVGGVLAFDTMVVLLLVTAWFLRGHVPDFHLVPRNEVRAVVISGRAR